MSDCIVAIATPPFDSIHHIIRGSGKNSFDILKKTFCLQSFNLINKHKNIINIQNNLYGNIEIYIFPEPRSYTGENMFEIHLWGNILMAHNILESLLNNSATLAKEGEFTKRALLNGKKNFLEVEHLSNIYEATSPKIVKLNNNILDSKTTEKKLKYIYNLLLNIISELEATWDFVEHDIPPIDTEKLFNDLKNIYKYLLIILNNTHYFDSLSNEFKIAIYGFSNVGKSFIFKRLTGHNSIIANTRGTTREVISATKIYKNITFTFLDLPGYNVILKSDVEKLSNILVQNVIPQVDGIVFIFDLSSKNIQLEFQCFEKIKNKVMLTVGNKMDISKKNNENFLLKNFATEDIIFVSALKNKGFGKLLDRLSRKLSMSVSKSTSNFISLRQYQLLNEIKISLENVIKHFELNTPVDIIVDELKFSLQNFESLFGIRLDEEILTNIMSKFCIGK